MRRFRSFSIRKKLLTDESLDFSKKITDQLGQNLSVLRSSACTPPKKWYSNVNEGKGMYDSEWRGGEICLKVFDSF